VTTLNFKAALLTATMAASLLAVSQSASAQVIPGGALIPVAVTSVAGKAVKASISAPAVAKTPWDQATKAVDGCEAVGQLATEKKRSFVRFKSVKCPGKPDTAIDAVSTSIADAKVGTPGKLAVGAKLEMLVLGTATVGQTSKK
jgi:hypothetical protein